MERHVKNDTKEKAEEMVDNIRATFQQMIKEADWMDESTRARALEKESATKQFIAYPQWLLHNDALDKFVFGENLSSTVKEGKYFESMIELKRLEFRRMFFEMDYSGDIKLESLAPSFVISPR